MLNEKQKLFCKELLKNKFDQRKSYKNVYGEMDDSVADAGASRLLSNVKCGEYIKSLYSKQEKKDLITVEKVLDGIEDDIKQAKSLKQISAALKGRELLGKYLKMFTDKIELDGEINLNLIKKVVDG